MLIKSKYDGIGRKLDQIDISIALDISGSMNCPINKKPTFKLDIIFPQCESYYITFFIAFIKKIRFIFSSD